MEEKKDKDAQSPHYANWLVPEACWLSRDVANLKQKMECHRKDEGTNEPYNADITIESQEQSFKKFSQQQNENNGNSATTLS